MLYTMQRVQPLARGDIRIAYVDLLLETHMKEGNVPVAFIPPMINPRRLGTEVATFNSILRGPEAHVYTNIRQFRPDKLSSVKPLTLLGFELRHLLYDAERNCLIFV